MDELKDRDLMQERYLLALAALEDREGSYKAMYSMIRENPFYIAENVKDPGILTYADMKLLLEQKDAIPEILGNRTLIDAIQKRLGEEAIHRIIAEHAVDVAKYAPHLFNDAQRSYWGVEDGAASWEQKDGE